MVVIGSFKRSLNIIKDNPIILGVAFVLALIGTPGIALQTMPLKSTLFIWMGLYALLTWLISPFFYGGILGMAGEATKNGVTKLSTFIQEGKRNYVSLLIAYIIFFIFIIVVTVGFTVGGVFIGASIGKFIIIPIVLIGIILFLIVAFFLQFFDAGIVLNHYGVIETFKKSAGFVRKRIVSVFGYSILRIGIMLIVMSPTFAISFYSTFQKMQAGQMEPFIAPLSPEFAVLYAVSNLIFATLFITIFYTFHTVFYTQSQSPPS